MKKKNSWLAYITPYLLIIAIIGVIILFWGRQSGMSQIQVEESRIVSTAYEYDSDGNVLGNEKTTGERARDSFLWKEEILQLNVATYRGRIALSGTVV